MVLLDNYKGFTGDKGLTGETGDKGFTGDSGPTGDKGFTGDSGPTGDKGFTGDSGPRGDTGFDGNDINGIANSIQYINTNGIGITGSSNFKYVNSCINCPLLIPNFSSYTSSGTGDTEAIGYIQQGTFIPLTLSNTPGPFMSLLIANKGIYIFNYTLCIKSTLDIAQYFIGKIFITINGSSTHYGSNCLAGSLLKNQNYYISCSTILSINETSSTIDAMALVNPTDEMAVIQSDCVLTSMRIA